MMPASSACRKRAHAAHINPVPIAAIGMCCAACWRTRSSADVLANRRTSSALVFRSTMLESIRATTTREVPNSCEIVLHAALIEGQLLSISLPLRISVHQMRYDNAGEARGDSVDRSYRAHPRSTGLAREHLIGECLRFSHSQRPLANGAGYRAAIRNWHSVSVLPDCVPRRSA